MGLSITDMRSDHGMSHASPIRQADQIQSYPLIKKDALPLETGDLGAFMLVPQDSSPDTSFEHIATADTFDCNAMSDDAVHIGLREGRAPWLDQAALGFQNGLFEGDSPMSKAPSTWEMLLDMRHTNVPNVAKAVMHAVLAKAYAKGWMASFTSASTPQAALRDYHLRHASYKFLELYRERALRHVASTCLQKNLIYKPLAGFLKEEVDPDNDIGAALKDTTLYAIRTKLSSSVKPDVSTQVVRQLESRFERQANEMEQIYRERNSRQVQAARQIPFVLFSSFTAACRAEWGGETPFITKFVESITRQSSPHKLSEVIRAQRKLEEYATEFTKTYSRLLDIRTSVVLAEHDREPFVIKVGKFDDLLSPISGAELARERFLQAQHKARREILGGRPEMMDSIPLIPDSFRDVVRRLRTTS